MNARRLLAPALRHPARGAVLAAHQLRPVPIRHSARADTGAGATSLACPSAGPTARPITSAPLETCCSSAATACPCGLAGAGPGAARSAATRPALRSRPSARLEPLPALGPAEQPDSAGSPRLCVCRQHLLSGEPMRRSLLGGDTGSDFPRQAVGLG